MTRLIKKIVPALIPFLSVLLFTSEQFSDDGRAGYTGSPGESNCTTCHSSFPVNSGGGAITLLNSGMPGNEYIPGQNYNISVTVTRSANNLFGFAFEALNSLNDNAGTLIITDPAETQIKTRVVTGVTRRNVVHQLNAGTMSGSKTFNFSWTAPSAGTGPVNFYFAGVAADGNGNDNNDYTYTSNLSITEQICQVPSTPSAIIGNSVVCAGSTQNYSVPIVSGATSYAWSFPGDWTGNSTTNSLAVVSGSISGNITVVAENSCGNSPTASLQVSVLPNPTTSISSSNDTLFASGIGTYQWYLDSILIVNAEENYLTPLATGSYEVIIIDSNGCTGISDPFYFELTNIFDNTSRNDFDIYPNPVSDILKVNNASNSIQAVLFIYDPVGNVKFMTELYQGMNILPVNKLKPGVYFILILDGNITTYRKIVIF